MPEKGTVLVTGGSGFLATWCIVKLLQQGYRVRTTLRSLARQEEVRLAIAGKIEPGPFLSFHVADLTSDAGWADAMEGCSGLLHVASPFPVIQPENADDLIVPAREGALRALRFALDAGVQRIVLTSSTAAVANPRPPRGGSFTEKDWSDSSQTELTAYVRSKTIAERAAWDYVASRNATASFSVVNPSLILGPPLSRDLSSSLSVMTRMLQGRLPGLPRMSFSIVDVRDAADLHLLALQRPEARGQRYIASGPSLWMSDIAQILRERLGADAAKVPTRELPNLLMRLVAVFDPAVRIILRDLGVKRTMVIDKARSELGWNPRPVEEIIVDTARALLAL
jgi:dihydroflavonol-4-reductase